MLSLIVFLNVSLYSCVMASPLPILRKTSSRDVVPTPYDLTSNSYNELSKASKNSLNFSFASLGS